MPLALKHKVNVKIKAAFFETLNINVLEIRAS